MKSAHKKTRKAKTYRKQTFPKERDALNIPELKQAWDKIRGETNRILKETTTADKQVKEFQSVWKKIFHRPVSAESAEAYLKIKRFSTERPSKKTRKMKGGALTGAPIDSTLQPGVYGTHGSFPMYQSQGLGFYDTINKQGLYEDCGVKDITPVVQAGGKVSDAAFLATYTPVSGSSVPGYATAVQNGLKGFTSSVYAQPEVDVNPGILKA
jgi:hypothetical protein